jgi:KDO2-lipid IV(A) lauroyltransferase
MYYLFVLGKIIARTFPRRISYAIARFCANLHFYLSRKDRETVMYNLSAIVSQDKCKACTKEVFINFAYYLVDFFKQDKLNKEFIEKYVKVDGLENLDSAFKSNQGVIILTAHLGNYELGAAVASVLGYPLHAIALPHKDKRTNKLFNDQRGSVGVMVIPTGIAVKKSLSILKGGGIVCFLADRDFSGTAEELEMFSRTAPLPKGPAFFALRSGACIVPSFFLREEENFYRLVFEEPIYCNNKESKSEADVIKSYIPVLEKYISDYPQQWYMFEKYWFK